jgi:hypothetical protein
VTLLYLLQVKSLISIKHSLLGLYKATGNTTLTDSQSKANQFCEDNSKNTTKTNYITSLKNKGILITSYESLSSIVVMCFFGFIRSILEINPLFHKPLDLESGKFSRCLFRTLGP